MTFQNKKTIAKLNDYATKKSVISRLLISENTKATKHMTQSRIS